MAENISLQWKNVFLSCGIFLICGRSFYHWKNIFRSSGRRYFVALEGKISRGREYFCCMEENTSILWKTLFLFCVSKYLCPRENIIASCGNHPPSAHFEATLGSCKVSSLSVSGKYIHFQLINLYLSVSDHHPPPPYSSPLSSLTSSSLSSSLSSSSSIIIEIG